MAFWGMGIIVAPIFGGFGIITSNKQYLKFDDAGNQKILSQLKSTKESDHLRVNVSGTVKGDTIQVTSVKLL